MRIIEMLSLFKHHRADDELLLHSLCTAHFSSERLIHNRSSQWIMMMMVTTTIHNTQWWASSSRSNRSRTPIFYFLQSNSKNTICIFLCTFHVQVPSASTTTIAEELATKFCCTLKPSLLYNLLLLLSWDSTANKPTSQPTIRSAPELRTDFEIIVLYTRETDRPCCPCGSVACSRPSSFVATVCRCCWLIIKSSTWECTHSHI